MKIRFHIAALLVPVLALIMGSCTDEYEYSGAKAEGEQVYFSNALSSTVELTKTASTIDIPMKRIETSGELTVPLTVTIPDGADYKIPAQVTFPDGSADAVLTLTYDPSKIEYGKYDTLTVAVQDAQYTTPYGASSYTFAIGMSEWKDIAQNNSLGIFSDGLVSNVYGFAAMQYNVKIQESAVTPGMYRLVAPYGEGTDFYTEHLDNNKDFEWATGLNNDIIIDATDPDYVYITGDFYPGVKTEADGTLHIFSYVDYYLSKGNDLSVIKEKVPQIFGKLKDGVITFPANSLLANFDTSLTPLGGANSADLAVALPGYALTDYSSAFEYTGRFTDTKGNDYAQGTITLGADVAKAKYAVTASGTDLEAFAAGIADGSVESTEITASGDVKVALSESGKYTMVVLTYDAAGEQRSSSASEFTFKSSKDASADNWKALYKGTFTYNAKPAFITDNSDNPVGSIYNETDEAVLYQDKSDPTTYKIAPWGESEEGLVFKLAEDNTISFIDVETGTTLQNYGMVYAADAYTKEPKIGKTTSYYDKDKKQFVFGTLYYVSDGYVGGAYETFDITGSAEAAKRAAKALKAKSQKATAKKGIKVVKPIFRKAYVSKHLSK